MRRAHFFVPISQTNQSASFQMEFQNFVPIIFLLFFIFSKNCQGARLAGGNGRIWPRIGDGGLVRPMMVTTKKPRKTTTEDYYDEDGEDEGIDRALVTVGPIIIPTDSSATDESDDLYSDEDGDSEEQLRPSPDRAPNCHSLAHLCFQHAYRRLLQRFCQSTCGRDDCLDQREDLCIHWKRRGFCTNPFYSDMRWKCARSCGICRPIHA